MKALRQRLLPWLLGGAFVAQSGWGLLEDASVGDEHPHLLAGYLHWKSGVAAGGFANPPVGQLWLALPLHLSGRPYAFPDDRFLIAARLPVLLASILLVWIVWRWGHALGGPRTGWLALAALALEPNLIAHSHLATLDGLSVVAWWAALWWWRRAATTPGAGWKPALACIAAIGLGAQIKFTGGLVLPALGAVGLAGVRPNGSARRFVFVLVGGAVVATLAAIAVHGFDTRAAFEPLAGKWRHRGEVHFAYLGGRRSEHGFPHYYLVALGLKTPLALLGLAVLGILRVPRRDRALLLLPAALLIVAFTLARVHIGLRHVLAVSPAIVLGAAAGARALGERGRIGWIAAGILGAATAIGIGRNAPQSLAYFNIAAGGSAGGHRWLLDSNLDWGQDDRRLARWLAREPDWEVNPNLQPARPGRFLVNANSLHNLQRRSERPYDWLRDWEPNRRVGAAWHSYEITLADFERRAAARPDDPLACIAYAEAVAATGDSMLAARAFARALQRFGTDPRVAARTSRWAAGRGDFAIASRALAGAARAAGRADVELQLAAERLRLESKIHAANSDSAAGQAALAYGIFLSEVGEGEAALPWLDRAAAALPGDVEAQRAPAVARVRRAQFAPARRHLEASPLRADLEAEIALCRNYEEWETAVGRGTTVPRTALHELGRIQFDAGELDAAAASFLAILRDHPDDAQALAYLGEAQVRSKLRVASGRIAPRRVR